MNILLYDGTFEGFLSTVYEVYYKNINPDIICNTGIWQPRIFDNTTEVITQEDQARRVWKSLCKKLSSDGQKIVYYAFLSESKDIEMSLLRFVKKVFVSSICIEQDFGNPDVLEIWQQGKKVAREIHRINMFVRFQKTKDNIYYAGFDPDFDILHLAVNHFKNRYADQQWIIYDTRRNFGFYYDLRSVTEISLTESNIDINTGRITKNLLAEDELDFQKLWKIYFNEMSIEQRKNLKLQRKHMPRRFWKYLVEKW